MRRLPDLLARARAQVDAARPERDAHVIQGELARQLSAQHQAYVRLTHYRDPPSPCSTGEHSVASVEVEVTNATSSRGLFSRTPRMIFWEEHLHEVEHHGRALTRAERRFLAKLPRSS